MDFNTFSLLAAKILFRERPRQRRSPGGASCLRRRDSPRRCWRLPPPGASRRLEHRVHWWAVIRQMIRLFEPRIESNYQEKKKSSFSFLPLSDWCFDSLIETEVGFNRMRWAKQQFHLVMDMDSGDASSLLVETLSGSLSSLCWSYSWKYSFFCARQKLGLPESLIIKVASVFSFEVTEKKPTGAQTCTQRASVGVRDNINTHQPECANIYICATRVHIKSHERPLEAGGVNTHCSSILLWWRMTACWFSIETTSVSFSFKSFQAVRKMFGTSLKPPSFQVKTNSKSP